jgi:molybdate transport repressor ModE-like protein
MDFRLKVFIAVAKHLSFTQASKELHISQPAITKHIQELENSYNTQLFSRQKGKISLTRQGLLFLEHATKIVEGYAILEQQMQIHAGELEGSVQITASNGNIHNLMEPYLKAFAEKYPQITITRTTEDTE